MRKTDQTENGSDSARGTGRRSLLEWIGRGRSRAIHLLPAPHADPDHALRPGRGDARIVLGLWCLRKTYLPMLLVGILVGYVAIGGPDAVIEAVETDSVLEELTSPLVLVGVAVVLRVLTRWMAFWTALSLTGWLKSDQFNSRRKSARVWRLWMDRFKVAQAYRALRWTWTVRRRAHERLEPKGRLFIVYPKATKWVTVGAVLGLIIALAAI